ncbi:hypothetical protein AMATHDRAFT_86152 [Amanita thiersii Skay4041]|uniref:Uncharacterized protein n=1 Tax=Amanita thiersii Skay4041 TaxID=703135 RepID=A0A2A9NIG1_9AGAR|nr:hypothetical protein AMATHDRAFT_86152 [Amanita thiersii Skay4041]
MSLVVPKTERKMAPTFTCNLVCIQRPMPCPSSPEGRWARDLIMHIVTSLCRAFITVFNIRLSSTAHHLSSYGHVTNGIAQMLKLNLPKSVGAVMTRSNGERRNTIKFFCCQKHGSVSVIPPTLEGDVNERPSQISRHQRYHIYLSRSTYFHHLLHKPRCLISLGYVKCIKSAGAIRIQDSKPPQHGRFSTFKLDPTHPPDFSNASLIGIQESSVSRTPLQKRVFHVALCTNHYALGFLIISKMKIRLRLRGNSWFQPVQLPLTSKWRSLGGVSCDQKPLTYCRATQKAVSDMLLRRSVDPQNVKL